MMLHPIVAETTQRFLGEGPALSLPLPAERWLRARLRGIADRQELLFAVRSLVALAAHVELDHGSPGCADAILRAALAVKGALLGMADDAEHEAHTLARGLETRFRRFADRTERARAPRYDGGVPLGALRLSAAHTPRVFR